jgi:hypothetical protein
MGITHLSTLRNQDLRLNSYLMLIWMDPAILIHDDYPDQVIRPDWDWIPQIYAQMLLKLYRFSGVFFLLGNDVSFNSWILDPVFVPKGLSVFPFVDQSQQMLVLWNQMCSMLNTHRAFHEAHRKLLSSKDSDCTTLSVTKSYIYVFFVQDNV